MWMKAALQSELGAGIWRAAAKKARWQGEALPPHAACFNQWEIGDRMDLGKCIPYFPLTHGLCSGLYIQYTWRCPIFPESTPTEGLAISLYSLSWSGGQNDNASLSITSFFAHLPFSWTLLPWVCISLTKHYSINPCLRFCFLDNLVKVTTNYTSRYILSHVF